MVSDEEIISKLKKFGLSETEAKVYLFLIKRGKSTAKDICNGLFIPDSKVYDVLKNLQKKGFIKIEEDVPRKYVPINPRICLSNVFEDILQELKRDKDFLINIFEKYYKEERINMEILEGYNCIRNRIREIFNSSERFDILLKSKIWVDIIKENISNKEIRLIIHKDLKEEFKGYKFKVFNGIFHDLMIISNNSVLLILPKVGKKLLSCIISDERSLEYAREYFNTIWNSSN